METHSAFTLLIPGSSDFPHITGVSSPLFPLYTTIPSEKDRKKSKAQGQLGSCHLKSVESSHQHLFVHPSLHMLSIKCHRVRGNLVYSWVPNCRSNTRSNTPLNKENTRQRDASSQRLQTGCHRALPGFKLSSEGWVLDSTTLELQQ